jgi:broad specificity phosphatase PhoE
MTWMLLARHGETDWNREGRWQGQTDVALNETGREQARELAVWLAEQPLDVIVASDLKRAHETALIVAAAKGMVVSTDAGLREIDVGSWGGLTPDEIAQRFPGMSNHDGETNEQHLARVIAAFRRIGDEHRGKRMLIVSHGKTLRVIRRHATGRPVPLLGNCETAQMRFDGESFVDDWGERARER